MKWCSRPVAACMAASCALVAVVVALPAGAQTRKPDPQARYDRELARCHRGTLPAPARDACVRQAGLAFDRATGGITGTRLTTSPDGRATVMEPSTGTPVAQPRAATPSSPLITTPDGRATVVNPSAP